MKGPDELGAHVSVAGGVERAPERAAALDSVVLQLFTKQPSRWAEPTLGPERVAAFRAARAEHGIRTVVSHDSYLINLASSDSVLHARSLDAFRAELERCERLGLEYLVTHPGSATDGDRPAGVARNGAAIARALADVGGEIRVLLEGTSGSGNLLGATFEELAALRDATGVEVARIGICLDTCHLWAAGIDLVNDYDGVFAGLDAVLGTGSVELFHLNDSRDALGSRRDRHAWIGEGSLGDEPFRRLLLDERFTDVPKVIETPKGKDHLEADRSNLGRLRGYRESLPARRP